MTATTTIIAVIAILSFYATSQMPPSWIRDNSIDAGEVKPIYFSFFPAVTNTPGTSFNYTQPYNKTNFNVAPRVVMAQLAYIFQTNSSTASLLLGYNITMGAITNKNFTFKVDIFGANGKTLHFIYLAVSPIYDSIYNMQNYYPTCTNGPK